MAIAVIPFMAVFGTFYFLRKEKEQESGAVLQGSGHVYARASACLQLF